MKKRDFAFGDVRTHSCVIAAEFSADVDAGFRRFQLDFQWFEPASLPFNQFSPLWPINTFSTDYICSFEFSTGSNGFQLVRWQFQQVFNRLCWQFVFNRFSTGRQTGFQRVVIGWQWSFHAMAIVARRRQQAAIFSSTLAQLRPRSQRAGR